MRNGLSGERDGVWTVLRLIDWSSQYLASRGFDECRLHVEYLLGHVLKLPRLDLYLQFDRPLTPEELGLFKELFRRRMAREPLQYILGEATFMGLQIEVNPSVLIPRPETELLVERALDDVRGLGMPHPAILDVGTGSGIIAVALAQFLPGSRVLAVDADLGAIAVAKKNAARHGVQNVEFQELDILAADPPGEAYDLIISNPPYIPARDYQDLQPEVRLFEPRKALTDEADGLTFARRLIVLGRRHLSEGGLLYLEIGFGQAREVGRIIAESGYEQIVIGEDYSHIPRVVRAQNPRSQTEDS